VPVDGLREHPTREEAHRPAGRGDERVDADRLRLLARLGEHRDDHPEDHGGGHRAADALQEARSDEHLLGLGEAAEDRGDGEDPEAGEEDAAARDQVAQPAGEKQEPAERDQVGVHDPCQARLGEAEVLLHVGEGDVHDRHVEHDHQHPDAEDDQRGPAGAVGGGCRVVRCHLVSDLWGHG
jgi:hypothetical protein